MRKLPAILLAALLLAGCSVLDVSPRKDPKPVQPQPVALRYPGAPGAIMISPDFRPAGNAPLPLKNGNETSYFYIEGPDDKPNRLLVVRHYFYHNTAGLSTNLHETVTEAIERRPLVLPSGSYQYALYRTDGLLRHEQEFLTAKGVVLPERFLAQSVARRLPAEGGPLADVTYIVYLEDLTRTDNAFTERAGRAYTIE